jgi:hypothetical protein
MNAYQQPLNVIIRLRPTIYYTASIKAMHGFLLEIFAGSCMPSSCHAGPRTNAGLGGATTTTTTTMHHNNV